jgi:hypothetical protein
VTGVWGGTRLGPRLVAAVLLLALAGCAEARMNPIAPGRTHAPRVNVPDAVDTLMEGFSVHLDPTVMLWARDAKLDLPELVRDTLGEIDRRLRGSNTTVHISAGSFFTIPDVGIGGFTDPSTGVVRISMDAKSPLPVRRLLATWLPITLAHELHHSRRILDGPGYGDTLLDAMIAEGSAEAFVREVYPDAPPIPWVRRMSERTEARTWRKARTVLRGLDDASVHQRWFFGEDDIPRWAGYKIGYRIANAYLDHHPSSSAADLALLKSADIYRGSRYDPRD